MVLAYDSCTGSIFISGLTIGWGWGWGCGGGIGGNDTLGREKFGIFRLGILGRVGIVGIPGIGMLTFPGNELANYLSLLRPPILTISELRIPNLSPPPLI